MKITPEQANMMQMRWQADPILFMTEVLDVKPEFVWDKMEEIAYSVRDNNKTGVFAGHSVSKTYTTAQLVIWFLAAFGPKATVITTAPSDKQVEEILWREIADAYSRAKAKGAPLGGVLTKKKLDMGVELDPKEAKWFALGFATKPDTVTGEATNFQGYHNDHVFVVFDEAAGILSQIWKAASNLLTSEEGETEAVSHWRWLAIGNPTSPYGAFAELEDDEEWNVINISVLDTPNYKEEKLVIPGLSGRKYEKMKRDKYGVDSNEYKIRVLGQKPTFGEGTFYGEFMAQAMERKHIKLLPIEDTAPIHTFWDVGTTHTAIIFVQLVDNWLRIIDGYYDNKGTGWNAHANMMQLKAMGNSSTRWNYNYGDHWAPPDLWGSNAKNMSGQLNVDIAREAGIDFQQIAAHTPDDRLAAGRAIIATKVLFDKGTPGVDMVIDALRKYRQRKNERESTEEKPEYFKEAVKDWTRHVADAFGHMAIVYRFNGIKGHAPDAEPELVGASWNYDPFEGGL